MLVPGADREEICHDILVPGLPRHAQRRTPFALRTKVATLNPEARVHVCPAAYEELHSLKLTVCAGVNMENSDNWSMSHGAISSPRPASSWICSRRNGFAQKTRKEWLLSLKMMPTAVGLCSNLLQPAIRFVERLTGTIRRECHF